LLRETTDYGICAVNAFRGILGIHGSREAFSALRRAWFGRGRFGQKARYSKLTGWRLQLAVQG
jgi:hypothetical protein